MNRVAIVAGSRTPIAKARRAYRDVHPADLLAASLAATVAGAGVPADAVAQLLVGCTHQMGEQALNVGRNAWLAAGLPYSVPALTLDAQCCSGQEAAILGAGLIGSGQADLVAVGGVESLSRVASGSTFDPETANPYPESLLRRWDMPHQSVAGERMAGKYGITRDAADAYGVASHLRAAAAWQGGRMDDEVVHVPGAHGPILTIDEGIRGDSSLEAAAALKPAFSPDGILTAVSSSQLSDGAASLLLASEKALNDHSLRPLAWIRASSSRGADPELMLEGPVHATADLLKRTGLAIGDIDAFEIHEAFAVPVLMWMHHYGVPHEHVNLDGGAIALGHPFGASGVRQLLHLAHQLRRGGGGRGLQVMCGGGGLGTATVVESA